MTKCNLLFVDDEIRIIRSLSMVFRKDYNLFTATSAVKALEIVRKVPIHVLVSDQRMPGMLGVDLLQQVKEESPHTMRILLTGYSDVGAVVDSINEGEVFRYITKPWVNRDVKATVDSAARIAQGLFGGTGLEKNPVEPEEMLPFGAGIMVLGNQKGIAKAVEKVLGNRFNVFVVDNFSQAVALMEFEEIGLIFADIRNFSANYVTIIKILKREYPLAVSVVLTDAADLNQGIELINQGQVFRYLTELSARELRSTLIDGLRYYQRIRKNPEKIHQHAVEPAKEPEAQKLQGMLANRLPNIRRKMAMLLQARA